MRFMPLLLSLIFAQTLTAATLHDISFPDTEKVEDKELVLNGLGTRIASVLLVKLKVYVAGLYLEKKSSSTAEIMDLATPKKIIMHFMREVSRDKIADSWSSGITKNCKSKCEELRPHMDKFLSMMSEMQSGDKMSFTMFPDRIQVTVKGKDQGVIFNGDFAKSVLAVFIGEEPPNPELKKGLLGIKAD